MKKDSLSHSRFYSTQLCPVCNKWVYIGTDGSRPKNAKKFFLYCNACDSETDWADSLQEAGMKWFELMIDILEEIESY